MAGVSLPVVRLVALIALLACAPAATAEPAWTLAPLAGGREQLLPRLGLAPDVPAALALGEIIRVVHASRDPGAEQGRLVRQYFDAAPVGRELIPVPLDVDAWQALLGGTVTADTLIERIVVDRRASLLCYGLLQLDESTTAFIGRDAALLRQLRRIRHVEPPDSREPRRRVRLRFRPADDVSNDYAAREQCIGQQRTVTAPTQGFGAHDGNDRLLG